MIDVSDPESVRSVAEEITNPKAWITLLVNNAGFDLKDRKDDPDYFQSTCTIVGFSAENVSQSVRINALAPTELVSKLVPVLAENGVVLNITSWVGSIGGKSSGDWTKARSNRTPRAASASMLGVFGWARGHIRGRRIAACRT